METPSQHPVTSLEEDVEPDAPPSTAPTFPVVGIGASAGGLEALQRLFERVPADSGMAFVVVQHLSPDFKSLMEELLGRHTALPVRRVTDGMQVEPNAVYLIPPNADMIITSGRLHLTERDPTQALTLPIDLFLRSLAQDAGDRAVAVILSGTGSDGSRGLRAVHESGGLVLVQDEDSAKFDGMPRSAVETGLVDHVLPPEAMPQALVAHFRQRARSAAAVAEAAPELDGLAPVFALLRRVYGIDFTHYKPSTVGRRVQRRLTLTEVGDLATYVQRLQESPGELDALYRDLMIGVTRFFRDPDAFARLREALRATIERLDVDDELRGWIAGCATGEEAYTVAMVALDISRKLGRRPRIKLFATDAHRASLEVASVGRYDAEALAHAPEELRDRYFQPQGDGWLVRPELRQHIVFAPHNVLRDAPFTRLDLITCRNLLIYFQPQAQKKAISLFHFGLKAGGLMLLGPSESPGELSDEFQVIDERWKLYRKRRDVRLPTDVRLTTIDLGRPRRVARPAASAHEQALEDAQRALLRDYAPPCFVVDPKGELLHALNGASDLLAPRDGPPSVALLELIHKDLKFAVAHGLKRAADVREPSTFPRVRARLATGERLLEVGVRPVLRGEDLECALVTFRALPEPAPGARAPADTVPPEGVPEPMSHLATERIDSLEVELRQTKENLQATIEEMETSNEELQATNEELVASNEELQSTNEELHSVNEELYTVNAECQQKIAQLTELTADMDNLLASTEVHTLFLDRDLRLRKFTPKIAETFNLLPQDLGRRIDTFTHGLQHEGLLDDIRRTLEEGTRLEREVVDKHGRAYLLRILPYVVRERIEGAVFTLIDVTALKQAQEGVARGEERYRTLVRALSSVVWTSDATGRFVDPQPEWEGFTGQRWPAYRGHDWVEAVHPADQDRVRATWASAVARAEPCEARGRLWSEARREHRHFLLRAAPIKSGDGSVREWIATIADVHEEMLLEQEHRKVARQLEGILENSPAFIHVKDLQGRYLLANPGASAYLGVPREQALGRSDLDLLAPEVADAIRGADRRVAIDGKVLEVEETLPAPSGPRVFLSTKFPLRDDDGKVVAVAGISSDITERKRLAEEDRRAIERRDRFLAMLSHELRNPLAALVNAVYTLRRPEVSAAARVRAPEVIQRQLDHMARLLDDLLDVSRFTRDRIDVRKELVDLKQIVATAVDTWREPFAAGGLTLTCETCAEPTWVTGDSVRLQQVVSNLLSNAAKYTPSGGRVHVALDRDDGRLTLRVKDTGIGIERDKLEKAFELFYQGEQGLARTRGGLGVGLTLVRALVHLHGGAVRLESEGAGAGTEAIVTLPAAAGKATPTPAQPPSVAGAPSDVRVVVVEDISDSREMLALILQEAGYQVTTAADGVSGVETIRAVRPQVAFVDVGLPHLDGYEVARRARADLPGAYLVAVTGYGRAEDRRQALEAGFDEHLVKPLSPAAVLQLLDRVRARG